MSCKCHIFDSSLKLVLIGGHENGFDWIVSHMISHAFLFYSLCVKYSTSCLENGVFTPKRRLVEKIIYYYYYYYYFIINKK